MLPPAQDPVCAVCGARLVQWGNTPAKKNKSFKWLLLTAALGFIACSVWFLATSGPRPRMVLSLPAMEVDVGDIEAGEKKEVVVAIANKGDAPLEIHEIIVEGVGFSALPKRISLAPNNAASVTLVYQAGVNLPSTIDASSKVPLKRREPEVVTGRLLLRSNDPSRAELILQLKAREVFADPEAILGQMLQPSSKDKLPPSK